MGGCKGLSEGKGRVVWGKQSVFSRAMKRRAGKRGRNECEKEGEEESRNEGVSSEVKFLRVG